MGQTSFLGSVSLLVAVVCAATALSQAHAPCDDEDEGGDGPTCSITKVTTELEAVPVTATFWGSFCDDPVVYAGQRDGTVQSVLVLSSGASHVTVSLEGNAEPADTLFVISCPCAECSSLLTVGKPGPPGPDGPSNAIPKNKSLHFLMQF